MSAEMTEVQNNPMVIAEESHDEDDKEDPPIHEPFDIDGIEFAEKRQGLSTEEAAKRMDEYGPNEIKEVTISLWIVFLLQFTGTMPYMLEVAAIIAIICTDYIDFVIIAIMLIANASIGFHEKMKAAESLRELTQKMELKIMVLRDGVAVHLLTKELVPGDVIFLQGGTQVPADVEWLDGDPLSVDTAQLTGETIPRKYGKDNSGKKEKYGLRVLSGSLVVGGEAYCYVRLTGEKTKVGSGQKEIMEDKTKAKVSVFEQRILIVVAVIISVSCLDVLAIFLVLGMKYDLFAGGWPTVKVDLLACLAIIVAAIPIALPIVLNVTMALGAGLMATEYDAVVTSLPALQDISSMTVLCSDKTGTLTTAKITIQADQVWRNERDGFTYEDVALYAVLAANRDKKEDPIDRSVVQHYDKMFRDEKDKGKARCDEYVKTRSVGFDPKYKRTLYEFTHPVKGNVIISKGLPAKVLNTYDGCSKGEDDGADDQWMVTGYYEEGSDSVKSQWTKEIEVVDYDFSKGGFKTLGVSVKIGENPWQFVGILPQIDPPRHDTAQTIRNIQNAGVEVKMITGDHLNIAKTTAEAIGMKTKIHKGDMTRRQYEDKPSGKQDKDGKDIFVKVALASDENKVVEKRIRDANGFAQVLPKDKREVVEVLRNNYNMVVGMTGDGVNDAPALSAAQCGIAVDDATDAAKNAAAIILTTPGLSAIYNAIVESRRIFRKLKSYVTYRFAASIQIVCVLSVLVYASGCAVNALLIIILALFNDLTLLPIAYDYQQASSVPENPSVTKILCAAAFLGLLQTICGLIFDYLSGRTGWFISDIAIIEGCSTPTQGAIWLQMFISSELLIFSTRAPTLIWWSLAPSPALCCSVLGGCVIASLLAAYSPVFGGLATIDILLTWIYCIICLVFIDMAKVLLLRCMNDKLTVLPEIKYVPPPPEPEEERKSNLTQDRLNEFIEKSESLSDKFAHSDRKSIVAQNRKSMIGASGAKTDETTTKRKSYLSQGRISMTRFGMSGGEVSTLKPSAYHVTALKK